MWSLVVAVILFKLADSGKDTHVGSLGCQKSELRVDILERLGLAIEVFGLLEDSRELMAWEPLNLKPP